MHKMIKVRWLGALMLAAVCAARAHAGPVVLLEDSVESTADQISLPSDPSGIVTVHACPACATQTFYIATDADLYVNGSPVTVAALKSALDRAGKTQVTVHYRIKDKLISRIILVTP